MRKILEAKEKLTLERLLDCGISDYNDTVVIEAGEQVTYSYTTVSNSRYIFDINGKRYTSHMSNFNVIEAEEQTNDNMKQFTIIYKDGKVVNQNTLTSVKQIIELDRLNINIVINNLNNDILVDNTKLETTLVQCDLVEDIESISIDGDYVETD